VKPAKGGYFQRDPLSLILYPSDEIEQDALPPHFRERWIRNSQNYPQRRACRKAGVKLFGFHILRHAYAAQAVMAGMPLRVLAANLDHTTTRVTEQHYAHLMPSYVRDTVRRLAPSFGIEPDNTNVVPLKPTRRKGSDPKFDRPSVLGPARGHRQLSHSGRQQNDGGRSWEGAFLRPSLQ
jgi:hypothetical protein